MRTLPKIKNGKANYRGFSIVRCAYAERSGRFDVYNQYGVWEFDCESMRKIVDSIDSHFREFAK